MSSVASTWVTVVSLRTRNPSFVTGLSYTRFNRIIPAPFLILPLMGFHRVSTSLLQYGVSPFFVHSLTQEARKLVQGFVPAGSRQITHLTSGNTGMPQGEPCPSCLYFKDHRHEHLGGEVRAHTVIGCRNHVALFIGKTIRADDSFGFFNFPVNTGTPEVFTFRGPHAKEIGPPHAEIDRAGG